MAVFLGALPASALFSTRSGARADRLVTLREIASKLSLTVTQPAKKILLQNQTNTVELSTEGREARVNGQLVWLNAPPSRSWGRWCLTETDAQKIVLPLLGTLMKVSKSALNSMDWSGLSGFLVILVTINGAVIALAYLLFPYLWKD